MIRLMACAAAPAFSFSVLHDSVCELGHDVLLRVSRTEWRRSQCEMGTFAFASGSS